MYGHRAQWQTYVYLYSSTRVRTLVHVYGCRPSNAVATCVQPRRPTFLLKKSLPFLEWRCPLQSSRLIDFSLVLIRGRLRDRSIWLLFNNYTFSNNCSLLPVPFARLLALVAFLALPQRFRALLASPAVWAYSASSGVSFVGQNTHFRSTVSRPPIAFLQKKMMTSMLLDALYNIAPIHFDERS